MTGDSSKEGSINAPQKMLAACYGSLLTSLLVTPLDVVRVRIQMQQANRSPRRINANNLEKQNVGKVPPPLRPSGFSSADLGRITSSSNARMSSLFASGASVATADLGVTACCREVFWGSGPGQCMVAPPSDIDASSCVRQNRQFSGTWEGLSKIARYEGFSSLWRGLSLTLLIAAPSNVIYFVSYDYMRSDLFGSVNPVLAPLLAGSSARAISSTVVSPLEMFKTRLQAVVSRPHGPAEDSAFRQTWQSVKSMTKTEGPISLWRGLLMTLFRDVPFSAIYWLGYEQIGKSLIERQTHHKGHDKSSSYGSSMTKSGPGFAVSFLAGASSGSLAAFLTTPFDVLKTHRQVAVGKTHGSAATGTQNLEPISHLLKRILHEEGIRGLFSGVVPRVLKVAPACAIMISSYEAGKNLARKLNIQQTKSNILPNSLDVFDEEMAAVENTVLSD